MLGNGGTTAFWDAAIFGLIREPRRASAPTASSPRSSPPGAAEAPFLADPVIAKGAPGTLALPPAEDGVDVYAWAHNETSTGVMAPVAAARTAPTPTRWCSIDATSGAGGLPVDIDQTDVYYFAPQKSFAADGGLWVAVMSARRAGAGRRDQGLGPLDPRLPGPVDRRRQLRQGPDLQHPCGRDAVPAGRPDPVAARPRRALRRGGPHAGSRRAGSTAGRRSRRTRRRSSPTPTQRSLVVGTIDFDESVDAAAVATVLRANGVVDIEPYRKLGRNQLRVGMFPAVDPDDVSALTACIDHVVERL